MVQKPIIDKAYFEKAKKHLITKEQRQKAEDEAKLLGTAMQQLLPEIFEDKRAIPNCFLRGALFGMVRKGRRALVENQPIFTMSQYEVAFSGSEMDQNDLELWDTLIYLAKQRNIENELRITLYDLCQQMRLTDSMANREAVTTRAKRLVFGKVSIKTNTKEFYGGLISVNSKWLDYCRNRYQLLSEQIPNYCRNRYQKPWQPQHFQCFQRSLILYLILC